MNDNVRDDIIARLHDEGCSCIICNGGQAETFHGRGVSDLHRLLTETPERLAGAFIADKVVGKGAAALMVLGGADEVYADVMSRPALELLRNEGAKASYGTLVQNIINRRGDGICPVESLCRECTTAAACLPLISAFIARQTF